MKISIALLLTLTLASALLASHVTEASNDWVEKLAKYIMGLPDGDCKTNIGSFTPPQPKDKSPCQAFKDMKTDFETNTKCSDKVFNDIKDIICAAPSSAVISVVTLVACLLTSHVFKRF